MASLEVQFANGIIPITVAVRRFKSFLPLVSATSLQRKVRPNYTRIRYRRNEKTGHRSRCDHRSDARFHNDFSIISSKTRSNTAE